MNRLANESSPYLLQHARNPVNWFPWGEEAFAEAKERNVPIFLSVGYSACHWCHVMEHESFDNPAIAALMNEHFVNIKVDREERPDLDQIYMNAVMAMTRRGGWPMSVFLTHDLKPFFCGTYWPPEARMNMPGFRQILMKLTEAWQTRRNDIEGSAEELADAVRRMSKPRGATGLPDCRLIQSAMGDLLQAADGQYGGFGSAPKFPHPMDLRLLLRCAKRFGSADALHVVRLTCDRMAAGGIYDHLGGGFARYSTDTRWLVPHFEKMLYDNALLTTVYAELFQETGEVEYARVLRETLGYIKREMTLESGAFCSAQDADSEGEEGKFFVWSLEEVEQVLGQPEATVFSAAYDVTPSGNWEGKNILNRPKPLRQVAEAHGMTRDDLVAALTPMKKALFDHRCQRVRPGTDDKVIAAWNGMMISGMALASRVLAEPMWAQSAAAASNYIMQQMRTAHGRLLHTSRQDKASVPAFLDDYACLIDGLIELYQATFDESRIDQATELADVVLSDFRDEEKGAFFYTAHTEETPITRVKDSQDGATPSGNAMLATALLKLAVYTDRHDYLDAATSVLAALDGQLRQAPMSGAQSLIAADNYLNSRPLLVIRSNFEFNRSPMLTEFNAGFYPGVLVAVRAGIDSPQPGSPALDIIFRGRELPESGEAAWICRADGCLAPVTTPQAMTQQLNSVMTSLNG